MPSVFRLRAPLMALALAGALAACDTAAERAETHYQTALELIEAGETERAVVELRNVFDLDGEHTAARELFAGLLRDQGELREAWGQYLRLVEQDSGNFEGHAALAELALAAGDAGTAATHARRAHELDPDSPRARALKAAVDYAEGDRTGAVAMARAAVADDPAQLPGHLVIIADRINADAFDAALPLIDAALAAAPEDRGLHTLRLGALESLGDAEARRAQLERMVEIFPDDTGFVAALVDTRIAAGDLDGAEAALRAQAARDPENPDGAFRVVAFLMDRRGAEAARAELEALAAQSETPLPYRRALGALDFAEGRTEAGIAALEALIAGSEPSDARRDTQIALARMLAETGDPTGRDALVDAVLAEDSGHVAALMLRARRNIDADAPQRAVQDLRVALEQAPRDPEILTLMAEAHLREGARDLAGERLALAVEASGRAPAESLRYARFLLEDGRAGPAEAVIVDALRGAPQNPDLLAALAGVHLERRDWARAAETAAALRAVGDPAAARMADGIEAAALRAQDRMQETATLLREMVAADRGDVRALAGLLQTYVETGDLAAARDLLDARLAEDPGSVSLRMMQAGLLAAEGQLAEAETGYREIIATTPDHAPAYRTLFALLQAEGRAEEAEAVIDAGVAATEDPDLIFAKASLLEQREDFDAAIALYERLYAQNSASDLVANNLASLLTTHRADPESLERAFAIARRLRASNVPHFQDTYGWILNRRGDPQLALTYLEQSAPDLPDNPLAQYHLGMTYLALERREEARAALARAVALAGPASALPQIAEAIASIAAIDAPEEAEAADE